MNVRKRNPLDKETFFKSKREKWFSIMLAFLCMILFVDAHYDIEADSYLNFLIFGGSVFLAGQSVDSFMKIKSASNRRNNNYHSRYDENSDGDI